MLVAAISALDVAFVAAIGTALAAIAGPFFAWRTGISTRRHERSMKAYDDIRASYIELLHYLVDMQAQGNAMAVALDRRDLSRFIEINRAKMRDDEMILGMVARAAPFTVGEISNQLSTLAAEMRAFHAGSSASAPQSPAECDAEAGRLRESIKRIDAIIGRINVAMSKQLLGPD